MNLLPLFLQFRVLLSIGSMVIAQQDGATAQNDWYFKGALRDTLIHDTFFLVRHADSGYYHAIYIEKNRRSQNRRRITDFTLKSGEKLAGTQLSRAKSSADSHAPHQKICGNWVPLNLYDGKLYLYAPSGAVGNDRIQVNGESIVQWSMEGPVSSRIVATEQINENTFRLMLPASPNGKAAGSSATFRTLDQKTKLSLFEFSDSPALQRYQLYIPAANAGAYDMIVNHCRTQKQPEYEFERVTPGTLRELTPHHDTNLENQ